METFSYTVLFILLIPSIFAVGKKKTDTQPNKVLIASYDVAQTFHSHFMESLAVFLSRRYAVSFLTNDVSAIKNKDLKNSQVSILCSTTSAPTPASMKVRIDSGSSPLDLIRQVKHKTEQNTIVRFAQPGLIKRIQVGNYSLIIYNSMDYGMAALCHYVNISCVQVITSGTGGVQNPLSLELINTMPYMLTGYVDLNSIKKRLVNMVNYFADHYLRIYYFYPGTERIAREHGLINLNEKQSYWQIAANTPVTTLIYTNSAIDCHVHLPPSYVRVGGAFLSSTTLSHDYQTLMDRADRGVVIVAFGRGAHQLPDNLIEKMLGVFSEKPQLFIWSIGSKYDELQRSYTIPRNVVTAVYIPQNSLLAHPNCQLFITHAGLGSTIEAVYNSVPIIAIPFAADQKTNAARLVQTLKMGVTMNVNSLTAKSLSDSMAHVVASSEFSKNAKQASILFHTCGRGTPFDRLFDAIEVSARSPKVPIKDRTLHWIHILSMDLLCVIFFSSLVAAVCTISLILCLKDKLLSTIHKVRRNFP